MASVVVSITTKKQTVPASPPASGNMRFQLVQNGVVKVAQNAVLPALSTTFTGVADGVYNVVVQRLNTSNQPIGDALTSADFSVVNTSEIDVPETVNVTVS